MILFISFRNSRIVSKAAVEKIYSFFVVCLYIHLSHAFHSSVVLNYLCCSGFNDSGGKDGWLRCIYGSVRIPNVSLSWSVNGIEMEIFW